MTQDKIYYNPRIGFKEHFNFIIDKVYLLFYTEYIMCFFIIYYKLKNFYKLKIIY